MTEEEKLEHLKALNDASHNRKLAEKGTQQEYNDSTWMYAKQRNWFVDNGIDLQLEDGKWVLKNV